MEKVKGSFKDPKGYVYRHDGCLYRKITEYGLNQYWL